MGASNFGSLFKILAFGHSWCIHARQWCHLAYVNTSYPMSVAGIGELRFCLQWAFKHAPLSRVPLCISWAFLVFHSVHVLAAIHLVKISLCGNGKESFNLILNPDVDPDNHQNQITSTKSNQVLKKGKGRQFV